MSVRRTITADDDVDRQRYRCPHGHANLEPTNNHWYCRSCARAERQGADITPEFDAIRDQVTGEELRRDEVEIEYDEPRNTGAWV